MSSLSSHIDIMKERSKENDEHYSHDHHHRIVIPHLPSPLSLARKSLKLRLRTLEISGEIPLIQGRYLLLG